MRFTWIQPKQPLGKTLVELAKSQGENPDHYLTYRRKGFWCDFQEVAAAKAVQVHSKTYAVVVQTADTESVPGIWAQQVVLLTAGGKILDKLGCDINSRLGETKTQIHETPEKDGAQVVVRFVARDANQWWHGRHAIVYEGKTYTFWVDRDEHGFWHPTVNKPNIWTENGLCRVKIVNDKFSVIFPKLETPEKESK